MPPPSRISRLTLRDLLLLQDIDELGSLQRVAERLCVSQPAVTLALKGLEEAFGATLVSRSARGVSLTPAGRAALQRLAIGGREVAAAVEAARRAEAPPLRLGCSPVAALRLVPQGVQAFLATASGLGTGIVLHEGSVPQLWQQLATGEVDAIVSRPPDTLQHGVFEDELQVDVVGAESMAIVGAAATMPPESPDIVWLSSQRWILPPRESLACRLLADWFLQAGMTPPAATITSASFATSMQLAAGAGMLAIVPEAAARDVQLPLGLRIIAVDVDWGRIPLVFASRRVRLQLPSLSALRDAFLQCPAHPGQRPPTQA